MLECVTQKYTKTNWYREERAQTKYKREGKVMRVQVKLISVG